MKGRWSIEELIWSWRYSFAYNPFKTPVRWLKRLPRSLFRVFKSTFKWLVVGHSTFYNWSLDSQTISVFSYRVKRFYHYMSKWGHSYPHREDFPEVQSMESWLLFLQELSSRFEYINKNFYFVENQKEMDENLSRVKYMLDKCFFDLWD